MTKYPGGMAEFKCELIHETDKAWRVLVEGRKRWVAKSKCQYDTKTGILTVPIWIVKKEKWVYYSQRP